MKSRSMVMFIQSMFLFSLTNLGGRHFSSHWRILEFVIRSKWCVEVKHWGKLVDAYRFLHKEKDMERGFSWSGNPVGKYRGKRMRIDYFVASEKLKDQIVACEMHGQGIELQGTIHSILILAIWLEAENKLVAHIMKS